MDSCPIGIFDSGLGGLTALAELRRLMPKEDFVYFGDCGRAPYGGRPHSELRAFTGQAIEILKKHRVKAILAACGTTSSVALPSLGDQGVPVFGVIEPVSREAAGLTQNGKIGIIATKASIDMGAYEKALLGENPELRVFSRACPLFVPLIESGRFLPGDSDVEAAVSEHLSELRDEGVDTLLLGCTHYPLMKSAISAFMGAGVSLPGAGEAAAKHLASYISGAKLSADTGRDGKCIYITSGGAESFRRISTLLAGLPSEGEIREIKL